MCVALVTVQWNSSMSFEDKSFQHQSFTTQLISFVKKDSCYPKRQTLNLSRHVKDNICTLVGIEGKAVEKHVNIVLIIRVIIFHPMDLYPSFFFMVFSVYTVFATIYQVFEFLNWYKGAVCGMPFNINLLDPKQSTNQLTTDWLG